ncbi:MAG TPA: hypothetical protein VK145_02060 [Candidatus Nanoarchaeia archaeon]|nr:hypothetical protein [Candidatus Nanoarchaeia archaeon]
MNNVIDKTRLANDKEIDLTSEITVTPLMIDNSVTVVPSNQFCIPQTYKFIRFRIRYGYSFCQLHRLIQITLKSIGKFGAENDPQAFWKYRTCVPSEKSAGICPLSSIVLLSPSASYQRLTLFHKLDTLTHHVNRIINKWSYFTTSYNSIDYNLSPLALDKLTSWPLGDTEDSQEVTPQLDTDLILYPKIDDTIVQTLNFLRDFRFSGEDLDISNITAEQVFNNLAINLDTTNSLIDRLVATAEKLTIGLFPEMLFPFATWVEKWLKIQGVPTDHQKEQERKLMYFVSSLPLTAIKLSSECTPLAQISTIHEKCVLDAVTLAPWLESMQILQEYDLKPFPFPLENKWFKVSLNEKRIYRWDDKLYYLKPDDDLHCLSSTSVNVCKYCTAMDALPDLQNGCIKSILERKSLIGSCPVTQLEEGEEKDEMQIIPHEQNTEIVISKGQPSSIIEECTGRDTPISIPAAAQILLNFTCTAIKMINAPRLKELSPLLNIVNVPFIMASTENPLEEKEERRQFPYFNKTTVIQHVKDSYKFMHRELTVLRDHFDEHGYLYLLSLMIVVCALIWIFIVLSMMKKCREKCRIQRRHNPGLSRDSSYRSRRRFSENDADPHGPTTSLLLEHVGPLRQPIVHDLPAT